MKLFATIIFVLIFVLAEKSQSQDILQKQIACNSISITNRNLPAQIPIILQDLYYDGQDTNDLDSFVAVSDLPDSYYIFQYSEIRSFAPVLPAQRLIQIGEFLLNLPPPSLSI